MCWVLGGLRVSVFGKLISANGNPQMKMSFR
uniref:Uncharacterized protein n=1 Tax=Anguilla anguilla TaxID=7936 RepID=A0A0E9XWD5_ANGAN